MPVTSLRLVVYRVGDPNGPVPIYHAGGSTEAPGRWNTADAPVIYAAMEAETAIAEKERQTGELPPGLAIIAITIPPGTSVETVDPTDVPDWNSEPPETSCTFGACWVREGRSAILMVPSEADPSTRNVVINPAHPDAIRFEVSPPQQIS